MVRALQLREGTSTENHPGKPKTKVVLKLLTGEISSDPKTKLTAVNRYSLFCPALPWSCCVTGRPFQANANTQQNYHLPAFTLSEPDRICAVINAGCFPPDIARIIIWITAVGSSVTTGRLAMHIQLPGGNTKQRQHLGADLPWHRVRQRSIERLEGENSTQAPSNSSCWREGLVYGKTLKKEQKIVFLFSQRVYNTRPLISFPVFAYILNVPIWPLYLFILLLPMVLRRNSLWIFYTFLILITVTEISYKKPNASELLPC